MTLLAPGALALAAALTVPPLIVFYLLKLRRRPLRVTSTMLWEQAAHDLQVNIPFRWIRPSWLLLLHTLILALLLIAVGRPAVEAGGTRASSVFVLLDRSASMNARDMPDGGTRLDAAKRLAASAVERLARGASPPEFTLVTFAAGAEVVAPPTRDSSRFATLINAVEPTDQPGRPSEALALVRSLTTGAGDEDESEASAPLRLLVSDGGALDTRTLASGEPTRVERVEPISPRPPNAGIVAFSVERDPASPEMVGVFVRLLNAGPDEVAAPLAVRLDDTPVERRAATIPAAGAEPGESVETFRFRSDLGGLLTVTLEHEDALEADDRVAAVLPPFERPATLLVVPAPADGKAPASTRDLADPFLLDVLEAIGTAGLRVVDADRFARSGGSALEGFGLIVFDRVAPLEAPARPTLSFGAAWPGLGDATPIPAQDAGRTGVLAWDRAHPVMRDVVLDSVLVADRFSLPEDDAELGDGARVSRRTLARGATGPLIVEIDDAGTPRLVVGFALEQSNWPVHFSFPIFMLNAFDRLVPGSDRGVWFDTATEAVLRLERPAREVRLEGPVPRTINAPGEEGSAAIPLGTPTRAGVYTAFANGQTQRLAVNLLDPGESSLAWGDQEEAEGAAARGPGGDEGPVEVWWFFVAAAGALLLVEWLVYAGRARF